LNPELGTWLFQITLALFALEQNLISKARKQYKKRATSKLQKMKNRAN